MTTPNANQLRRNVEILDLSQPENRQPKAIQDYNEWFIYYGQKPWALETAYGTLDLLNEYFVGDWSWEILEKAGKQTTEAFRLFLRTYGIRLARRKQISKELARVIRLAAAGAPDNWQPEKWPDNEIIEHLNKHGDFKVDEFDRHPVYIKWRERKRL